MSAPKAFVHSIVGIAALAIVSVLATSAVPSQATNTLPAEISDAEFWRMIVEFSEPGGSCPYENFVSNEVAIQHVIPALKLATKPGGVFIGVGPEQNFTFASVLQSKLAFVIDIRRQNMIELLMYKALFELSPTRVDFVSKLFSRVPPAGLDTKSGPEPLFAAYEKAQADANLYLKTLEAMKASMTKHGFQLSGDDLIKIDYVFQVFYRGGPAINYEFSSASPLTNAASYSRIMNSPDTTGRNWAFLANEENYQYVREMQRKNLIVPLVGDFAGPAVIRNIGRYLKERNSTVTAFYVSNVESYLDTQQMQKFYANVATLPVDSSSTFIRFIDGNHTSQLPWWKSGMANLNLISPMSELVDAVNAGRRPGYDEMLRTTRDPVVLAGLSRTPDLGVGPIVYVPKGGPAPVGYVLIGTVRQTIQFLNGTSTAVDLDVYTKK